MKSRRDSVFNVFEVILDKSSLCHSSVSVVGHIQSSSPAYLLRGGGGVFYESWPVVHHFMYLEFLKFL